MRNILHFELSYVLFRPLTVADNILESDYWFDHAALLKIEGFFSQEHTRNTALSLVQDALHTTVTVTKLWVIVRTISVLYLDLG